MTLVTGGGGWQQVSKDNVKPVESIVQKKQAKCNDVSEFDSCCRKWPGSAYILVPGLLVPADGLDALRQTSELCPNRISYLNEDSLNLKCLNPGECIANSAIQFGGT